MLTGQETIFYSCTHVSEKFHEVGVKEEKVESGKEVILNRPWCPDPDLNPGRRLLQPGHPFRLCLRVSLWTDRPQGWRVTHRRCVSLKETPVRLGRRCKMVAVSLLIRWRRSSQKPLPAGCLVRGQLKTRAAPGLRHLLLVISVSCGSPTCSQLERR